MNKHEDLVGELIRFAEQEEADTQGPCLLPRKAAATIEMQLVEVEAAEERVVELRVVLAVRDAERDALEVRVAVLEAERLDAIEKGDALQARVAELETRLKLSDDDWRGYKEMVEIQARAVLEKDDGQK